MVDQISNTESKNKVAVITPKKEIESVYDAVEGSILPNGKVVEKIFYKSKEQIIYACVDEFGFNWKYTVPSDEKSRECIRRYEQLFSKYRAIRKGITTDSVEGSAISTLRTIFQDTPIEAKERALNDLEKEIQTIKPVEAVIARGTGFRVWIDHNGNAQYIHKNDFPEIEHSISAFTRIKSQADALLPQSHLKSFNRRLGAALVEAFKTKPGKDVDHIFQPLEEYIQRCISNGLRDVPPFFSSARL